MLETLFSPSNASPLLMEASPMSATVWRSSSPGVLRSATAIPKAAEIELPA